MLTLLTLCLASMAHAHVFISSWGPKGGQLQLAQKTDLKSSSYRVVSDNTGWVGSKFLTTDAIACSAKNTPFGQVAAPTGFISSGDQSPGKSLSIAAGSTIQLVTSLDKDKGFPHRNGHIQAYLADCGGSCSNFDVTTGEFFKIHEELNGVQNTLIPALDTSVNGNRYNVQIPASVPAGNYIWRFEIITFGQSSGQEGNQDQYYPSCGSLTVTGGSGNAKRDVEVREEFKRATAGQLVKFPGAYQNGNIDQKTLPGPSVINGAVPSASSSSGSSSAAGDSGSATTSSSTPDSGSATSATGGSAALTLPSSAPACASMCLSVKISEKASLGAGACDDAEGACMCGVATFMAAFQNCANDNCGSDAAAATSALQRSCSGLSSSSAAGNQAATVGGSSSNDTMTGKSKRSSADYYLASGKSNRLHRVNKRGNHPVALAIRQATQH